MTSAYMKALLTDPQFRERLKRLREERPTVPKYDPKTDNVREVVHGATLAEGYDLAITKLESM